MRIHYIKHVKFEGLAHIGRWAETQGHTVTRTALYDGEPFAEPDAFDCLVVMGGPMGVHDNDTYDWLTGEKRFIEQVLKQDKKVLGICLGAQLIADVLGASVFANDRKEIGWFPVTRANGVDQTDFKEFFPEQFFAFHWHGDTFDLPTGALHLAQSEATANQAFFYPPACIGLQFHLESTPESIEALVHHCADELVPSPYVQTGDEIMGQMNRVAPSNQFMEAILTFLQE